MYYQLKITFWYGQEPISTGIAYRKHNYSSLTIVINLSIMTELL